MKLSLLELKMIQGGDNQDIFKDIVKDVSTNIQFTLDVGLNPGQLIQDSARLLH
jgi:hypothetical protein